MQMPKNKERLLQLADHIEKCKHDLGGPGDELENMHFQMNKYLFNCGSPACIAGHTCALFSDKALDDLWNVFDTARDLLQLTTRDATLLFQPYTDEILLPHACHIVMSSIKPSTAAKVIRSFVATGKVSWPEVEYVTS